MQDTFSPVLPSGRRGTSFVRSSPAAIPGKVVRSEAAVAASRNCLRFSIASAPGEGWRSPDSPEGAPAVFFSSVMAISDLQARVIAARGGSGEHIALQPGL